VYVASMQLAWFGLYPQPPSSCTSAVRVRVRVPSVGSQRTAAGLLEGESSAALSEREKGGNPAPKAGPCLAPLGEYMGLAVTNAYSHTPHSASPQSFVHVVRDLWQPLAR